MWLQEKLDWQEDLVYFVYWINKINKRKKYLSGWRGGVYSATSSCFDLVWRCCWVVLLARPEIQLPCDPCLAYLYVPDFGIMVRVFTNGQGDLGSIPDQVIPKTLKMVLDASLLNTQYNKVLIKGVVEKSKERSSALPYTLV